MTDLLPSSDDRPSEEYAAARDEWPGTDPQSTPAYEAARYAADPLGADPEPQSAEEPLAFEESLASEEPLAAGRRTRGRSLAEIRESLRVLQERSEGRGSAEQGGKRRARHAEPEADEPSSGRPAAEFLARYRDAAPERHTEEPAGESAEERTDPTMKNSAGLADLLAEALLAYEDGRRRVPPEDAEPSSQPGSTVSGITGEFRGETGRRTSTSDTGMSARHRRAAMDYPQGNQSWMPPSY